MALTPTQENRRSLIEGVNTTPCNFNDVQQAVQSIIEILYECCPPDPCSNVLKPCCTYMGVTTSNGITHPTLPGVLQIEVSIYDWGGTYLTSSKLGIWWQDCVPGVGEVVKIDTDHACRLVVTGDLCSRLADCCTSVPPPDPPPSSSVGPPPSYSSVSPSFSASHSPVDSSYSSYHCTDCRVVAPRVGVISPWWKINSSSYDQITGNWSVVGEVRAGTGTAQAFTTPLIDEGAPACPANPAITGCTNCGSNLPAGTIVTYTGTSTPPSGAGCCDGFGSDWGFRLGGDVVFFVFRFGAESCIVPGTPYVTWVSEGPGNGADASGCSGTSCSAVTTSRDSDSYGDNDLITVTLVVTGHTGARNPKIFYDAPTFGGCTGNTIDLNPVEFSAGGTLTGNGVTWFGSGNGTYTVTYRWVNGSAQCPAGTTVLRFFGYGDLNSGWHQDFAMPAVPIE